MSWRHRHRHGTGSGKTRAVRLTRAERDALRQWAQQRANSAAGRPLGQAASADQHHGKVEHLAERDSGGSLQRLQRENRQLRSQLEMQWSALYETMLQSTQQAAKVAGASKENRVLREQNERLLSNEQQAFRCIADNERKTASYRRRNRRLVRRSKKLLNECSRLRAQLADLERHVSTGSESLDHIESDDAESGDSHFE